MICFWTHLLVPIGGIVGVWIGGTLGGAMLQMPTQGRGISSALSQIGCIFPLTHMHSHAAKALLLLKSIKKKEKKNNFLI